MPFVSVTGAVGTSYNWSSAAMISDVQGWLDNPSTDFGWALVNADEVDATDFRAFYSRNALTASFHPQLTITYTPAPEPGTLAMLAIGGCALFAGNRRRRPRPINRI